MYLQVMDQMGHVSEVASDTVIVDTSDPHTHTVDPDDGDTDVDVDTVVTVQFSEEMDPVAIAAAFSLTRVAPSMAVQGAYEWTQEGRALTFTPDEPLDEGVAYHISIGNEATDIAGNGLYPAVDHTFETEVVTPLDTTPPTIQSMEPDDGDKGVAVDVVITITFSETMNVTGTGEGFTLFWKDDGEVQPIEGEVSWSLNGQVMSFMPDDPLKEGRTYRIAFGDLATDLAGNGLSAEDSYSFETVKAEGDGDEGGISDLVIALVVIIVVLVVVVAIFMMRKQTVE